MILSRITKLNIPLGLISFNKVIAHTSTCPIAQQKKGKDSCKTPSSPSPSGKIVLKRAEFPGKVRMAFIPEEWFLFFHSKTGVTGPYVFGIVLINYLLSKEIYVLEHEYYLGLSLLTMVTYVYKNFSAAIAASLDKEVEDKAAELEKARKDDMTAIEKAIADGADAQFRAKGQEQLMAAKRENVRMQQEAIYRERALMVHRIVKGRMDYHFKRHAAESRIHQKWMLGWIMDQVMKSLTPDFEKQALDKAIIDLAAAAGRA